MYLVVDANVIISCLIAGSWTLKVFLANSLSKKFVLISPEFLFVEIENNFDEIKEKTKLSSNDLAFLIRFIREEVKLVPTEEFEESIEEAESVSPDPKDVLRFGNKILVPYLEQ